MFSVFTVLHQFKYLENLIGIDSQANQIWRKRKGLKEMDGRKGAVLVLAAQVESIGLSPLVPNQSKCLYY